MASYAQDLRIWIDVLRAPAMRLGRLPARSDVPPSEGSLVRPPLDQASAPGTRSADGSSVPPAAASASHLVPAGADQLPEHIRSVLRGCPAHGHD